MTPGPSVPLERDPLPWYRRLETRVAVGITLLVGTALGAVLVAADRIVQANAVNQAAASLEAARSAFYHLLDTRAQTSAAQLRLVIELPVFRAFLPAAAEDGPARIAAARLASDMATLDAMAEGYRESLGAEFVIVTNSSRTWIANAGWDERGPVPDELAQLIARGHAGRAGTALLQTGNHLVLVVTEPATFADEVLGTLSAAYPLDDSVARELALITRCDVTLLAGSIFSGSSLGSLQRASLESALRASPMALGRPGDAPALRAIGGLRYVGGAAAISRNASLASPGLLVLLQDWRPTQAFIDEFEARVLEVGGVLFLLALSAGLVVSRRVTRPLTDMVAVTHDVAAGRWDRRIPVRGQDEVAALAGAFNDMTGSLSHWYEEAQSKAAALGEAYERFYALSQSAHDAIVSADADGIINFSNASASRIFGINDDTLGGRSLETLLDIPSRATFRERIEHLRHGDGKAPDGVLELTGLHEDGTTVPLEVSLSTWQSKGATHVTAILRDVTERKRAEEALRAREIELRQAQKMEAVGRLAGGVAHDFNNVLTAIRGYAELLVEDLPEDDTRREDAMQVLKAADTASSLTRQLLAFSRKQILAPRVIRPDEVVLGMQKLLSRLIGEDIDLKVRVDADPWTVRADPGQLEQVVLNLAVNARDAMPHGGRLTILVANTDVPESAGLRACGPCVEIVVADTGSGIDADTLRHIFEPFFTTKEAGKGTGLGLATVDGIVEQSGGAIAVESEKGVGTCFRVLLPRVEEQPQGTGHATVSGGGRSGGETVLLVEDEPAVRRFAHQVLMREGYRVIEAGRGEEALELACEYGGRIHLLLTDVIMPGMSGRVLSEHLTALRPDTRLLFMSGYTDDAVVRHGIRDTGLPFLQKPFSVQALADMVRKVLDANQTAADERAA